MQGKHRRLRMTNMSEFDELREVRLAKLRTLIDKKINPYPAKAHKAVTNQEVAGKFEVWAAKQKKITLAGRLMSKREHGGLIFGELRDFSGDFQVLFKQDVLSAKDWQILTELIDIGDFIEAKGTLFLTQKQERTLQVEKFTILAKSLRPLPEKWHGLADTETRFRQRYLDLLMNSEVKQRFVLRHQLVQEIRNFLVKAGFIEVDTPALQCLPGGALATPFVTHYDALDTDVYLRIAPELYLKRLIVGGFEKVFEITKVFRNEGIDHDHNPEFTMFEAQIAYQDYAYGMDIIEEIIEFVSLRALGTAEFTYQNIEMSVKRPWARYTMVDSIEKLVNIKPLSWKTVTEAKDAIQKLAIVEKKMKTLKTMKTVGECIAFVFEELVEPKLIQPTIIYDYPTEVSPLAKKGDDPRFTQRFEMFAFGSELGNNYSELNDPIDLKKRFLDEKKREKAGFAEAHQTDNDYLEAIEHGFPPTCGIAIGIDRLVMLLTDAKSIKEVIPFPTLRPEL